MLLKHTAIVASLLAIPSLAFSMAERSPSENARANASSKAADIFDSGSSESDTGWATFQSKHPGTGRTLIDGRIERIYGQAFSQGVNASDSAGRFIEENAQGLWGVTPEQMLPIGPWGGGDHVLPLMTDPVTGDAKFMLVGYIPHIDGAPVFDAAVRVLVRNEPGFPTVLVSSQIPQVEGFTIPGGLLPGDLDVTRFAGVVVNEFAEAEITGVRPVVFAGVNGISEQPRAGVDFLVTGIDAASGTYSKWRFVTDPATGEVLHRDNQILHADVDVQVQANRTDQFSMECGVETIVPLPHARVTVGGTPYIADENGMITIPNSGNGDVTVTAESRTQWFNLDGGQGDTSATIPSGGSGAVTLNEANSNDTARAQANGVFFAEEVRNFTLQYNSSYPVIATQQNFTINTGVSGTCNAFYNGNSINFYNAGGGCANTTFDVIVHHEYGHHLVAVAGSGQSQYGEGAGDCMGVLITGDSRLAVGFYSNQCNSGIRNADNNCNYSSSGCSTCGSAIHTCGQLLSGMVWEVRNELINNGKPTSIIESIFVNSMPMHNGTSINTAITIDWLTLDDDNGNILDGTPNYPEINAGCSAKGVPGPELQLMGFAFPNGLPQIIDPSNGASFSVAITPLGSNPSPSNARITYRVDGGSWTTMGISADGGNLYTASLPAVECGSVVQYYLAADSGTTAVSSPNNAPADSYSALGATDIILAFEQTFESNAIGWVESSDASTTSGFWERGNPTGNSTRGEPGSAAGGSFCLLTENGNGNFDIDGGCTTITSPVIDASTSGSTVSYSRWYDNTGNGSGADPNNDLFTIEVTDGLNGWTVLEVVGPVTQSSGGWYEVDFLVSDFVENTTTFQIRFTACDLNDGSVVEAAIDTLVIEAIECDDAPALEGDFNNDCIVDGADFGFMLSQWGNSDSPADLNGDQNVDGADVGIFLALFGGSCP
ncbi:MAG: hypothetical protein P8J59_06130 [Phycisphaerales bacterium]|jgi:hypothetical protein|nr:hypothetical protein [Phycisphaerales bacterium]